MNHHSSIALGALLIFCCQTPLAGPAREASQQSSALPAGQETTRAADEVRATNKKFLSAFLVERNNAIAAHFFSDQASLEPADEEHPYITPSQLNNPWRVRRGVTRLLRELTEYFLRARPTEPPFSTGYFEEGESLSTYAVNDFRQDGFVLLRGDHLDPDFEEIVERVLKFHVPRTREHADESIYVSIFFIPRIGDEVADPGFWMIWHREGNGWRILHFGFIGV